MKHSARFIWLVPIFSILSAFAQDFPNERTLGRCEAQLGMEYGIDAIIPDVGRSLLREHPFHLLPAGARTQEIFLKLPRSPQSADVPSLAQIIPVRPAPFSAMLIGPCGTSKSEMIAALNQRTNDFVLNHVEWWNWITGVRNIHDFWLNAPIDSFESPESPLRILPREDQALILRQIITEADCLRMRAYFESLYLASQNTAFSIRGEPPRQKRPVVRRVLGPVHIGDYFFPGLSLATTESRERYNGNLDPSPPLAELLRHFKRYYFGKRKTLEEADLKEVLRKHFYFRLAPTADRASPRGCARGL